MSTIGHQHRRLPTNAADNGFTLIEVVIAVVLLALITGAIAASLITSLNLASSTTQRIKESNDIQLIAGYLVRDAQAAGGSDPTAAVEDSTTGVSVTWLSDNGGTDPDPLACRDTSLSESLIARFAWYDRSSSTTDLYVVKYYYAPATQQVIRLSCKGGALDARLTLGNAVITAPVAPSAPSATCNPGCARGQLPTSVTFVAYELDSPSPTPYKIQLTAKVRSEAETAPALNNSFPEPLIALTGCPGTPAVNVSASADVRVYGNAVINSANAGGCNAMEADNTSSFNAGTTSFLGNGSCTASPGGSCPKNTNTYSTSVGNPSPDSSHRLQPVRAKAGVREATHRPVSTVRRCSFSPIVSSRVAFTSWKVGCLP